LLTNLHRLLSAEIFARGRLASVRALAILLPLVLVAGGGGFAPAARAAESIRPYLERASDRVAEFTLDNGMKFVVWEDHTAPTISFVTYAAVGALDEEPGKTGAAHFLEHLAFKGTEHIGTTDYEAERAVLDRLDRVFAKLQAAKSAGKTSEVERLQAEFERLQSQADEYVVQNAYSRIIDIEGGQGANAATAPDYTVYFYSLPSNKLELWMSLESERFSEPVFREFYKEKQVILEERRQRTDNSALGKLVEAFLDTAFTTHPYQRPTIGYVDDLQAMRREDVRDFFERYYAPSNLVAAIAGDVDPERVRELATVYFGRLAARPRPPRESPEDPPQQEQREFDITFPAQPFYMEGYHRPDGTHPDDPVYEILARLLGSGRTSRLYRALVVEQQVAASADADSSFPGDRDPNLMLLYAQTAPNATLDQLAAALHAELARLQTEPVTAADFDRVKTQARAALLRGLDSPGGMARRLAEYEAKTGSWRNLFARVEALEAVTADDVQRVARATFVPENRTVGRLQTAPPN